ncbi:MAG TPA: MBL fold metallo-hydrolase [Nevskiaceae bacterium]|nr:MBL fold metallo-hydrolase [Nevskiaceae bacterium]
MRLAMLGSGSSGNATWVEAGGTAVLVDCGFNLGETERRLERLGCDPGRLAAILVTHEHGDHLGGVGRLARRHDLPVWLTRGSAGGWRDGEGVQRHWIDPLRPWTLGALTLQPFPVPHDAREPCQFVIEGAGCRLGIVSDVGHVTPHMRRVLHDCDALLLECNHDPDLLAEGPYPPRLKDRVGGAYGHLSNAQAADLLASIRTPRLRALVLTHLSQQNNRPALARAAVCEVLQDDPDWCRCAGQEDGTGWIELA